MILYDTPGVIEKKMHKLDSMMMNNVRSAAVNADCALVVVDACKAPQQVFLFIRKYQENLCFLSDFSFSELQIDEVLEEGIGDFKDKLPILLVLNKKDLIKPGEIAKKLEVNIFCNLHFWLVVLRIEGKSRFLKLDLWSNYKTIAPKA